jgi:HJR/Mrr/RecB family endonuclease
MNPSQEGTLFGWEKRVIDGKEYGVLTLFGGMYTKQVPANIIVPVLLTAVFVLLSVALMGIDGLLGAILEVPKKEREWVETVGGFLLLEAIISGVVWWRKVEGSRSTLREQAHRERIEALLTPNKVSDEINYMTGPEFEKFMAALFRQKGYEVEETPLSGDQGVDLILPDLDGKRVVIQLKRWTGPVGNAAVQATFAGIAHYEAAEGWIITTGTFTKSARALARSTRVRLIDGKELADWLEGLREDE